MKKITKMFLLLLAYMIFVITVVSCNKNNNQNELYVYNWGLYIDDSVIDEFEKKYNIKVIYDMFDTNEEMYAVLKKNARKYDVLCPTDYMIEKMIKENLLYEFDFNELSNIKNIDTKIFDIMKSFDINNTYAIPYVHSTIGIMYNKTLLDKKNLPYPTSWSDLFDEKYKNEILMQDAMRDLIMVGLKKNNFSVNSTNDNELNIATNDLIKQKDLVLSYAIDQLRDKMVMGEGSISVMYSGEVEYIKGEGKNYEFEYILPKEGVPFSIDAWVIPINSENKQNAKLWIDFMLDKNIAYKNYDYMHYGISNLATIDLIKEIEGEDAINDTIFPSLDNINMYELYKDLGDYEEKYLECFKEIKSK